jgi:putative transcriptional regulator|tara:strand:+ start:2853 stop:3227 length:375 start_codon:yes stop_codon:yes gene_type:complete
MSQPRCPKHRKFLARKDGQDQKVRDHFYCKDCGFWWKEVAEGTIWPAHEIVPRVQTLMRDMAMSRQELAEETGLSYRMTCLIAAGNVEMVRFSTMEKLCRALDCQPGDLWVYRATRDHRGDLLS